MKIIRHYLVPGLLVTCTLLLAFWIGASRLTGKSSEPYDLTAKDFTGYQPMLDGWAIQVLPVVGDGVIDANIAAYTLVRDTSSAYTNNHSPSTIPAPYPSRLLSRLVHGYNMPMCMKMKYYTVEKIQDHQVRAVADPKLRSAFRTIKSISREAAKRAKEGKSGSAEGGEDPSSLRTLRASVQAPDSNSMELMPVPSDYPIPVQLWKLTSSAGTVSYWASTMIRSGDFAPTEEDICSMAFPRIDIPDDPNWIPRGWLALEEVKHPRVAFMRWYHSRWDGARWDVLTFLRLRPPARGSNELISYVTRTVDTLPEGSEDDVSRIVLGVHADMLAELQKWRGSPKQE
jgi:hypothetical protein